MKNNRILKMPLCRPVRMTVCAFAMIVVCGVALGQSKGGAPAGAAEAIPVRVQKVVLKDIERALDYVGDIKGQDEAIVYPKVTGKIIEKLKDDGAAIAKGEAIFNIDRDEIGQKFEKAPVDSPLAGVVGRTYVDRGASVTPQTPVAMVVNMENVKVILDIPERYLPQISAGTTVRVSVDAYPQAFTGAVSKISPVLDVKTRTAPVEVLLPNPGHALKPGMFARVRVMIEKKQGVRIIAKEAVRGRAPDQYVYVASDGVAKKRKVSLGLLQASEYEILSGLEPGELVVVMGQQRLTENAKVSTEER